MYFFYFVVNFFYPFRVRVRKINDNEFKGYLEKGFSLARWGDGEVLIFSNKSIRYQSYNLSLKEKLKEVFYKNNEKVMIATPYIYVEKSLYQLFVEHKLKIWGASRGFFILNYLFSSTRHADAFGFRKESSFRYKDIVFDVCSTKKIYVISSSNDAADYLIKNNIKYEGVIRVPSVESFGEYEKIKETVLSLCDTDVVFLCSAGPLSKVLALDVSNAKSQLIDMGHFFEQI